jgi:hypothetical protein
MPRKLGFVSDAPKIRFRHLIVDPLSALDQAGVVELLAVAPADAGIIPISAERSVQTFFSSSSSPFSKCSF